MVFKTLKPAIATLFSTIALTACSSADEPRQPGENDSNAIRFAANTEYSRAKGDITTNNLTSFNVYAYTGLGTSPVTFMDNVKVTKTGANTWTYSPIKYWPANEDVDFYAFSPQGWVGTTGYFETRALRQQHRSSGFGICRKPQPIRQRRNGQRTGSVQLPPCTD